MAVHSRIQHDHHCKGGAMIKIQAHPLNYSVHLNAVMMPLTRVLQDISQ